MLITVAAAVKKDKPNKQTLTDLSLLSKLSLTYPIDVLETIKVMGKAKDEDHNATGWRPLTSFMLFLKAA